MGTKWAIPSWIHHIHHVDVNWKSGKDYAHFMYDVVVIYHDLFFVIINPSKIDSGCVTYQESGCSENVRLSHLATVYDYRGCCHTVKKRWNCIHNLQWISFPHIWELNTWRKGFKGNTIMPMKALAIFCIPIQWTRKIVILVPRWGKRTQPTLKFNGNCRYPKIRVETVLRIIRSKSKH